MKKSWVPFVFGLLLLATVYPLAADVIGRKTMERRYDQSGECHLPYRESHGNDFGPILTPLYFTAVSSSATVSIEVQNRFKNEWLGNKLDKFLVVKRSVFENDSLWKSGGCVTGAYFDFSLLGNDPSIVYKELFTIGPGEWSGVGTAGIYWENGSLVLGHVNDPLTVSTSVTIDNLQPGEEYALSFWWYVNVLGDSAQRPTLTATVLDTPGLSNDWGQYGSIAGDAELASWDYFHVDIPEGTPSLSVHLDDLNGDADLYLRHGDRPDTDTFDCSSFNWWFSEEECVVENPAPGRWWIGVANYDVSSTIDYTVLAQWMDSEPEPPGLGFYTVPPCRLADTRRGSPLSSGELRYGYYFRECRIPDDAKALAVNVTVTGPTGPGYLRLWPGNIAEPLVSSVNFDSGMTRSNNAILKLGFDRDFAVKSLVAGNGTVHFILDVTGYFR